jgi:lysophospholipase L1-like esterase
MVIRLAALALLAAVAPASRTAAPPITAAAAAIATNPAAPASLAWVGTWAAAQVAPGPAGVSHIGFRDQTVRDVVHISAGGSEVRIRISNVFGTRPLRIADVRVAVRQGNGALIMPGTSHRVTFGGKYQVTIPVGQREFSDPVRMGVGAGQNLAVSIFVKSATGPATWHPAAIASSYYSTFGDYSAAAGTAAAAYRHRIGAWYFLDGVDVVNPAVNGAVVTFGASTSDGVGSTLNANERYPDDLARRLLGLPAGLRLSVLNAGVSGNQLLAGGSTAGPSGLSRFYRDALAQTGVRVVIVWLGTNDIGDHPDMTAQQVIDGYLQLIAAAHARGVAVVGATLQPDQGANYYTSRGNRVREEVNRWISTSGAFDAVADFDAVLRDPFNPAELLPAYDSGDHLHPNDFGYQAIADSIDPWTLGGLAIGYLPGRG